MITASWQAREALLASRQGEPHYFVVNYATNTYATVSVKSLTVYY
ncbi:hypothetical protein ACFC08_39680 [Streptomyces sp. NPDC056112]|nr:MULTISPECIES: hypothetical protein [unclassified Streptomyces]